MSSRYFLVDAFTQTSLQGNPCAVFIDANHLDDETMQAIAREMNLSETAFLMKSDKATFRARYFTPAEEIPMAGHPTLASSYTYWHNNPNRLLEDHTITIELQVGVIQVALKVEGEKLTKITMTQLKPIFGDPLPAEEIMPVFGLTVEDVMPGRHCQVVSTGTPQLMVPVKDRDALRRASLDAPAYVSLRNKYGFFSPHLFILGGETDGDTFARHFGVPPDTTEDPFTGSATGGMAAYLWHHGLIDKPNFVAEQGHWMHRPGRADVELIGPPQDIEAVRVGGAAVLTARGEMIDI